MLTIGDILRLRTDKAKFILLGAKGKAYGVTNTFHNFTEGGEYTNSNPMSVAFGYMTKHIVSCYDIFKPVYQAIIEETDLPVTTMVDYDRIEEKFGDAFNYGIIILGMIKYSNDFESILDNIPEMIGQEMLDIDQSFTKGIDHLHSNTMKERCRTFNPIIEANDLQGVRMTMEDILMTLLRVELLCR